MGRPMTDRNDGSQIINDLEVFLKKERKLSVELPPKEFDTLLRYSLNRMFSPVISTKPSRSSVVGSNFILQFADTMVKAFRAYEGGYVSFSVSPNEIATMKEDIENQMELTDHPLVLETKQVIDSIIVKNSLLQE